MPLQLGALKSSFAGLRISSRSAPVVAARPAALVVQASKTCDLTRARRNAANSVSFSNKKTRKWQGPNLQTKKIYWPEGKRWVRLTVTTRALRTIEVKGLQAMAKEAGIDLNTLPFEDVSEARLNYLAENKLVVPVSKKATNKKMKNAERLAASTKKPMVAKYIGARIVHVRQGEEAKLMQMAGVANL